MSVLFAMPTGISDDMEQALTSIQAAFGKQVDALGKWTDVPYSAGNFRASVGLWTVELGDQSIFHYTVVQNLMFLQIVLIGTSTDANVTTELRVFMPSGFALLNPLNQFSGQFEWSIPGTDGTGFVVANGVSTYLRLIRDAAGTNWPINRTNDFSLRLNLTLAVTPT